MLKGNFLKIHRHFCRCCLTQISIQFRFKLSMVIRKNMTWRVWFTRIVWLHDVHFQFEIIQNTSINFGNKSIKLCLKHLLEDQINFSGVWRSFFYFTGNGKSFNVCWNFNYSNNFLVAFRNFFSILNRWFRLEFQFWSFCCLPGKWHKTSWTIRNLCKFNFTFIERKRLRERERENRWLIANESDIIANNLALTIFVALGAQLCKRKRLTSSSNLINNL